MMLNRKGGWIRWHYDVQIERVDGKEGQCDVEMKGWMQKGTLRCAS